MQVIPGQIKNAVSHVDENLLPLNYLVIDELIDELKSSSEVDLNALIEKIKGDIGLLIHCLQKVNEALEDEGVQCPEGLDCVSYLRWAGEKYLIPILEDLFKTRSQASIKSASEQQVKEFAKTCISASTTEALAAKFEYSLDQGYSLAVIRQLGYLLVAWNYPSTFKSCIEKTGPGARSLFDQELQSILGFSPAILAGALLQRWGLAEAARFATAAEVFVEKDKEKPSLLELCKLSEAFAQARCSDKNSSAVQALEKSTSEIKNLLGAQAMHMLEKQISRMLEPYAAVRPAFFKKISDEASEEEITSSSASQRGLPTIVALCQDSLKALLSDLYERIHSGQPVQENVLFFAKQIVTSAGFAGGCVFTFDALMGQLYPTGKLGTKINRSLSPIVLPDKSSDYSTNQVIKAFWDGGLEVKELVSNQGSPLTCFSGPLGRASRVGVLYLEMNQAEARRAPKVHQVHFHALCEALTDCLSSGK